MSPTMVLGRIILPGAALLLAMLLACQTAAPLPDDLAAVATTATIEPASPATGRIVAEGRVVARPGARVVVGSEVLGTVAELRVREKSVVRKGDLIAALRMDDVRAELREARARLAETETDLTAAEQAGFRLDRLLTGFDSSRDPQPASGRPAVMAARAHRDSARAAVERLEAEADKYLLRAPIDGVVIACHAAVGETVQPAAPIATIVDLRRLQIEAEVDEFDIGRVAPKAGVTVTAEGYPDRLWPAIVEEVADAVVPRQTRPEDPGQPSDTRVLPVRIGSRTPLPFKLGQRVEVEIGTAD